MKLLDTHKKKKPKLKSDMRRGGLFLLESVQLVPEVNIQAQQIVRGSNPFEFLLFKMTSTREFMNDEKNKKLRMGTNHIDGFD